MLSPNPIANNISVTLGASDTIRRGDASSTAAKANLDNPKKMINNMKLNFFIYKTCSVIPETFIGDRVKKWTPIQQFENDKKAANLPKKIPGLLSRRGINKGY
jgi:hypothetical protein